MVEATLATAERADELAAAWAAVAEKQAETDSLVAELKTLIELYRQTLLDLTEMTLPELEAAVANNAVAVSDINDTALVNLEAGVSANAGSILDLEGVTIPAIQSDVESQYQVFQELPHTFNQVEEPLDGDDPDRPLMIGDRWSPDGVTEYRWNGTDWVLAGGGGMDPDALAEAVAKFSSNRHVLYETT